MPVSKDRNPWPMKWIVLAILLVAVPYTFLTLRYRKPGPAFQPHDDLKKRANVVRLLAAGYQRTPLPAGHPADPSKTRPVATAAAAGGLPMDLRTALVEIPPLPAEITKVAATFSTAATQPYPIRFACTLTDDRQQVAGADLYLKDGRIVIAPALERLAGRLQARSRENVMEITIPAGMLKPGRYEVSLAGERASRAWSLEVK